MVIKFVILLTGPLHFLQFVKWMTVMKGNAPCSNSQITLFSVESSSRNPGTGSHTKLESVQLYILFVTLVYNQTTWEQNHINPLK